MRESNVPELVEEPVARAPLPLREEAPQRPPPPPAALPVRPRRPRWPTHLLRKLAVAAAALVAAYALLVAVVAPPIARAIAETRLTAALERPTTIERVTIQPFTLAVTVRGLMVRDRDGTRFASFDELRVNLQAMSLVRRGLIVRDLTLVRPVLRLVHDRAHHYNISDLFEGGGSPSSEPSRYSINNIRVVDGTIEIVDRPRGRTHVIADLTIALPFVSNLPYDADAYVLPALSARIGGTVVNLGARAKPFSASRETGIDLDVRDLQLARYFDYVPGPLGFTLPAATLSAALSVELNKPADERPRVTLSGRIALKDVVANDAAGRPLVRLGRLAVEIAPSQPLAGKLTLAEVQLDRPSVWVRRDAGGRLQLATLVPERSERARGDGAPAGGAPFVVEAGTVRLGDGTIRFFDAPAGGPFVATLHDVTLEARGLSTAAGHATALELHAASDAGERLDDRGTLTLTPLAARGHLSVTGIPLARYAPYHRPLVLVDVDGGMLDVAADYDVRAAAPTIVIGDGELALRGLVVRRRGERRELAAAALVAVHDLDADVMARTIQLGDVAARDGRLRILRAADGTLNLAALVAPSPAPRPAAPTAPWSLAVKHAAVDNWTLRFEDRRPDPDEPVRLTVALQSASIADYASTRGNRTRVALRARIDRRGALTASGTVVPEPLAAALRLDGKTIELAPFQPYFADRVNLLVTRGAVSFGGKLALATTAAGPKARYQGHLLVDELTTVDAEEAAPLLSWDSLYVAGIDATNEPPAVAVDEVSLSGLHARLAVDDAGALNVRGLVPPSPSPPSPSPPRAAGPSAAVSVGKVTLQDGTIDWADDFVRPRFAATLSEVGGRISGLSSRAGTVADVDLRGKLEGVAPLEISGTVNPLAKELALDLAVVFRDIELGPLSPYSGKYAGYDIARGKLTLELGYNVQQRKLAATNKVFIDQLQLGDRIKSAQATKLPVKFIVFVLRDRKGEIHLDLPITGSLDDPKFRLGPIILKAILNVLVKAATQPFAMLGSMFGRGPELAYVEFAPGRAELDAAALDKLRVVAKVLDSRPGLKLEISGHVGVDADRDGLRRFLFERKVKSQKLKALARRRVTVTEPLDRIVVAPDEYERYLRAAYDDEKFPKPRNAIGLVKKLPVAEMEKLMLTHILVPDEELRLLAQRRADAARDTLVKARIAPERVFVREPKTLAAPPLDKARATRVDFTIR